MLKAFSRAARAFGAAAIALAALSAPAAAYPDRPITLIVPFAPGGSTDLVARIVAAKMTELLKQTVVVENRGGAGGSLGATAVAKAAPDGYTILMATVATHALNPALYKKLQYDPVKDFAPITLLVNVPNVLTANPKFPAKSVKELIELAKKEPAKYAYASSGNGSPLHLSGELFKKMAGVDLVHIPYKGSGPALVDVLAGQVPLQVDNLPSSIEHIKGGRLVALGVTTAQRVPNLPDVPAIAETLPGYETYSWNALFAPAGTPPEIVKALHDAGVEALKDETVKKKLTDATAVIVGSTPEELGEFTKKEIEKWTPIVKDSGAQID
ncbi:Bug family tripartite tricarboxylate transporter substrate binding protein [Hansschlegelia zhihuaiae]|uniref:Tripartite tricarboxylate transporter substrate binding protein n=1 Tax=Hansschlegelia zhihuaiae TaxID=405005 RepID=A0A4Q0MK75_9HYPH|nr:tripartite tricarboxylate transporter substrate binding protein [Hansschlegelia zhihuaiae]RXF73994.1 tripartite tricarboxylate transporter substrate binding protein [Hansschlegelia zhihuaiae]